MSRHNLWEARRLQTCCLSEIFHIHRSVIIIREENLLKETVLNETLNDKVYWIWNLGVSRKSPYIWTNIQSGNWMRVKDEAMMTSGPQLIQKRDLASENNRSRNTSTKKLYLLVIKLRQKVPKNQLVVACIGKILIKHSDFRTILIFASASK